MTSVAVLVMFLAAAQAPGTPAAPAATISGRVTEAASGRPVPRMVVAAMAAGSRKAGEALTDADGRYEITGLAAGSYAVGVAHDEHRSTYLPQWFGETPASEHFLIMPPRLGVALAAGEHRTGVDVALTRALAIEGRITDPWGDPLAGVEVIAARASSSAMAVGAAAADDLGMYRIYGLAPGRYRVCVRPGNAINMAPPGEGPAIARTCYPAAVNDADSSDVTLATADVTGIDIRLQRVGSRSIAGTVIDAAGVPVEDAYVTAFSEDTSRNGSARARAGAFVLKGLVPGRYTVRASIGGARPGDADPPSREAEMGDVAVDVSAIDATNVTLALTKAVTVHGTVTFEGGRAPSPSAILRAKVWARPPSASSPMSGPPPTARVKDDLTFDLGDLFRTPVVIRMQDLPDGWELKTVRYDGRDITYMPTDFAGAPLARLDLVVTSEVARPTARITDDRGEETQAAFPIVLQVDPSRWKMGISGTTGMPKRLPDGTVELGTLLPGEYFVAALSMDDYFSVMRGIDRLDAVARVATKLTFEKGDTRTVTLRLSSLPDR